MPKGGSTRHKKLTDDELKEEKAYYDVVDFFKNRKWWEISLIKWNKRTILI
jgi:hypothetical protein